MPTPQTPSLFETISHVAPILGAGLTFLLIIFAIAAYVYKTLYHSRVEAIKRANPEDLPSMVGDEIDKLGINAAGLGKKDQYDLVKKVLDQREQNSRRKFRYLLVISGLIFIVAILSIMLDSKTPETPENAAPFSAEPPERPPFIPMQGTIQLQSDSGDYIGEGNDWTFDPANGALSVASTESTLVIRFRGDDDWELEFKAPEGKELGTGKYESAQRAAFHNPTKPGLDISVSGRGCNKLSGRFEILALQRNPDHRLSKVDATFQQYCDDSEAALRGTLSLTNLGATQEGHTAN
jgi:hypothetical protein